MWSLGHAGFFILNPGQGCLVSWSNNPQGAYHRADAAPGAGDFVNQDCHGESSFDFNGIYRLMSCKKILYLFWYITHPETLKTGYPCCYMEGGLKMPNDFTLLPNFHRPTI